MAQEAVAQVALQFTKGTIPSQQLASGSVLLDVAGSNYMRNVQSVGTAIEALLLGDVATPGLCLLHNLDATNYVDISADNTNPALVRLKPGDWALLRFASATPYAKANTAAINLEYFLLPN